MAWKFVYNDLSITVPVIYFYLKLMYYKYIFFGKWHFLIDPKCLFIHSMTNRNYLK